MQHHFPMRRSRVTLSDLAKSLHLSTCTVSKILNKSFDGFTYSPETIRRVEAAARRLGYRVNVQARALRTSRSSLIGFVLPTARVSMFGDLTDHLELALRPHGFQLLIAHSQNSDKSEKELVAAVLSRGVDGLFWIPSRETIDAARHEIPGRFPLVILDRPGCLRGAVHVLTDNRASARLLAERMKAAGHRRILAANAPAGDRSMRERSQGLRDVFGAGLRLCESENSPAAARIAVRNALKKRHRATALVALSEPLALGSLAALRDVPVEIPGELSFATFDDFALAEHWSPPITRLCQNVEALAGRAVEALLGQVRGHAAKPIEHRIAADLLWRESVASLF